MRIVIITQARMLSRRLPGKVLRHVVGKPLLQWHVERLQQVSGISEVVVETPMIPSPRPVLVGALPAFAALSSMC